MSEEVEKALAEELGVRLLQGTQPNFPKLWGKEYFNLHGHWSPTVDEIALWKALVSERIARLAAERERDEAKKRAFCQCEHPYHGTQILGTPPKCERCGKEIE